MGCIEVLINIDNVCFYCKTLITRDIDNKSKKIEKNKIEGQTMKKKCIFAG